MAVIKSTTTDMAVDYARAVESFDRAARELAIAVSLMEHHGHPVAYGKSVVESIELWKGDATLLAENALIWARKGEK